MRKITHTLWRRALIIIFRLSGILFVFLSREHPQVKIAIRKKT
jgi:hypothetical protein